MRTVLKFSGAFVVLAIAFVLFSTVLFAPPAPDSEHVCCRNSDGFCYDTRKECAAGDELLGTTFCYTHEEGEKIVECLPGTCTVPGFETQLQRTKYQCEKLCVRLDKPVTECTWAPYPGNPVLIPSPYGGMHPDIAPEDDIPEEQRTTQDGVPRSRP
ncbi:hypothetical protein COY95_05195 [Candidatus Woesearchaeota archaeon CG_4_10_14_0_8_um_filter_47_5]|nr:MAG: hypothetical protein COY95_05195 [Candidatus Woesearchaeota archaeon CG_4_10_14_0_8_um_filter_47_5]